MNTSIYDKTAKGRDEIATRKYQLAPRLRSLLVLIDGRRTEEELLRNVAGLGLTGAALDELLEGGLIVLSTSYATMPAAPVADLAPAAVAPAAPVAVSQAGQFQALYEFYNKTIKSTIGLRGFTLQLKVEKASSVEELRELRMPYLDAVQRAKGNFAAATLAEQLDQLLDERPAQART
ncbi:MULTISPECIES: hypothetical protein [unclassified Duganella]|uniref:hypothetical protein n=1 Tax=unclassified Duganella TaxID=2636909 RepID=UPI000E356B06|nr:MULTISPECIES: hypothetical protein [unclassified Duganella]RFP10045.1 hypothetical protein D0T23_23925 [Duganella sp. BJB475]RFP25650.1 hypothetical protein D0T21_26685 [Duganella sp. BJB476]